MPGADKDMKLLPRGIIVLALCSCSTPSQIEHSNIIGLNSFALAARYGTPASYQLQGEYMQLDYGIDATGCRLIVLVDQDQRRRRMSCPIIEHLFRWRHHYETGLAVQLHS